MIIGMCGLIGTGKDTVADILVNNYNFIKVSFADKLKDGVATVFSWDRDYYRMDRNDPEIVVRDKVYLPQFYLEPEKYEIIKDNEILLYWYRFCEWAMPMANEYAGVFEKDNNRKFKKMMIIRYWCPDGENTENYSLSEQREFCTEKFGVDHYDETYGSLHFGESYQ